MIYLTKDGNGGVRVAFDSTQKELLSWSYKWPVEDVCMDKAKVVDLPNTAETKDDGTLVLTMGAKALPYSDTQYRYTMTIPNTTVDAVREMIIAEFPHLAKVLVL